VIWAFIESNLHEHLLIWEVLVFYFIYAFIIKLSKMVIQKLTIFNAGGVRLLGLLIFRCTRRLSRKQP
jgi:hypothetical protein